MIVVDATVLGDLLVGKSEIRQSAERLVREDPDWVSVSLWRYELGNILWKGLRTKSLRPAEGSRILDGAEALIRETVDTLDAGEILFLAKKHSLSFYDASYVWLARLKGLKLRTRDGEILRHCPDVARPMPQP
jgi:predicted nucleic acid-binding protein